MHLVSGYVRLVSRWRWRLLLALLLLVFVLEPTVGTTDLGASLIVILLALILLGAIHAAGVPRRLADGAAALIVVWLLANLAYGYGLAVEWLLALLSLALTAGALTVTFAYLIRLRRVDYDAMVGAVFGYFLLAVAWSVLFRQIERWQPGSLVSASGADAGGEVLYFSLVTITTLGYGDVLPVDPLARIAAGLEAAVGTLYIAIMIGSIVGGFHRSHAPDRRAASRRGLVRLDDLQDGGGERDRPSLHDK